MKRTSFNDGWQFRERVDAFSELAGTVAPYAAVTVPHDAVIGRDRQPDGRGAVAFFPDGVYQYRKRFHSAATAGGRTVLHFEGVYRDAVVRINGSLAGQRPYGYSAFMVEAGPHLRPGENIIEVEARNGADSRWYSGGGIYRDVWLLTSEDVHVAPQGLRASTVDLDEVSAVVQVATLLTSTRDLPVTVRLAASISGPDGVLVAAGSELVTVGPHSSALHRHRLSVPSPRPWSAEQPDLYEARVQVRLDGAPVDEEVVTFGLRRLQIDAVHGLRVNGTSVKLRGACIHHDNGILGSATFGAAEERRVRLLKEAGFNALRSAHNPASDALLSACDRLGMYVIDETFDAWDSAKVPDDYALRFREWWERDIESMVAKDFNHPSVIMYSIGNEIPETGTPDGAMTGRMLAEHVRALDGTRFITNAVNGMFAVLDDIAAVVQEQRGGADGIGIDDLVAGVGELMDAVGVSSAVSERTEESFGLLDVAGMNYLDARYELDAELFPNRVIVGTETFPTRIDRNWRLVNEHSHLIGDFTWTGIDYLGEVGVGRTQYLRPGESPALAAPYPWIAAWCGDLDLIGQRRPASYYRQIVFGLREVPYIAVQRPVDGTRRRYAGPWTWSDSIGSWSWSGHEGRPLVVEVYSDADAVELALNGGVVGSSAAGPGHRYRAEFTVRYEPGTLTATAIRNGRPAQTWSLRSPSGLPRFDVALDRGDRVLRFLEIALTDAGGAVFTDREARVTVHVSGGAVLAALGSGDPAPAETYGGASHATFEGRALAVIRLTGEGDAQAVVTAEGFESVPVDLHAVQEAHAR